MDKTSSSTSTVVSIDGGTLSSLLFKLKNSHGDAEGFLVGEVCKRHFDAITDSQSAGVREEMEIHILSFLVLNERFMFYDNFGRPDIFKIQTLLGPQYKDLIGWFSYRCNTSHRISLRERATHLKLLERVNGLENTEFLYGLITEGLVDQNSIHSTEYSFHTWNGSFQSVDVKVTNLRASINVPYQTMVVSPDLVHRSEYTTTLNSQRSLFVGPDGQVIQATAVENLYRNMLNRLEPLVSQLTDSNSEVIALDKEVARLQELADELYQEKMSVLGVTQLTIHPEDKLDKSASITLDNLIDLNSPEHPNKTFSEQVTATTNITHDVLNESLLLEPALPVSTDLLQPLVVENKPDTDSISTTLDQGGSFIQQSQDLF